MIVQEMYEGDAALTITYSDKGMLIRQDATGDLYEEAIDPTSAGLTYTETDIPIAQTEAEEEEDEELEEIINILLGEDE